jgi:hypothetical protein
VSFASISKFRLHTEEALNHEMPGVIAARGPCVSGAVLLLVDSTLDLGKKILLVKATIFQLQGDRDKARVHG